jgi:small-conductance mechanosensitive channel
MSAADFSTTATFTAEHKDELRAAVILVLALIAARVVDIAISRRGERLAGAVTGGALSPVAVTRLRLVRRLVFALIVLIGLFAALAVIPSIQRAATALLASSAVLGLVVGFAARQTLANGIAGILLAITQPIRIGDLVTFEDETGEVEDVRLTYTYIRLDDGSRLIVPNERLAQSSVRNHTILDPRVQVEVSVWLPPGADLDKALALVTDLGDNVTATVAEADKEAVRLSANTWADGPRERGTVAAELRAAWLRRLREHGLSSSQTP